MPDKLKHAPLALLAATAVYGFYHEHLFGEQVWTHDGAERFLIYSAIYWGAAALFLFFAPRWLGPAAAAFVLAYTIWWSGAAAPLAVLYIFGSCFFLGRILWREADGATAVLLGLAAWISAIWIALHFAVNTRLIYGLAFAIPYLRAGRSFPVVARAPRATFGLALVLYFLLAYWLVALMPEISSDGLSMHLALPMAVAHDHRWAFDFRHYVWSLMPAGGDALFTAAYLLGGETAARLANLGLLVLIATMIRQASRQWLPAALFTSTPLVFLVTGSLFVENVWAAMILGAALALARYEESGKAAELRTAGALCGAALAVKLPAGAFVAPTAIAAVYCAWKRQQARPLIAAASLLILLAAPPYLYSWAKSRNPVFPFANKLFRSPDFRTAESFTDPRFATPISWRTPYDATFRSAMYFEGQGGGAGFQYFLLLIPALIFVRRRAALLPMALGASAALVLFAFLPNLRYLYPALPMFSIVIGGLLEKWRLAGALFALLASANAWFLGASGWYYQDFAMFRKSQRASYLESAAPERALVDRLNREAPGEPVAFFSSDAVAGLQGLAFTDSWHSDAYWQRLRNARTAAEMAGILRGLGIRRIVAPVTLDSQFPLFETFLREWAAPDGSHAGSMALFRLRDEAVAIRRSIPALPSGNYDDLDRRIDYNGAWVHDRQFPKTLNRSVTYCDVPGAWLRLEFDGSAITYVFTEAANRGFAEVSIDGVPQAPIDMYSSQTKWRSQRVFDGLTPGRHVFEVRVLGEKNSASSASFVDLDAIRISGTAP